MVGSQRGRKKLDANTKNYTCATCPGLQDPSIFVELPRDLDNFVNARQDFWIVQKELRTATTLGRVGHRQIGGKDLVT